MALDFSKSKSSSMVNTVMKKANNTDMDNKKRDIDVDLIDLNPDNEEIFGYKDVDFLADEISEHGFNGAIEVYAKKDGRYEISSGHRRYLAACKNGLKKIPCIVSEDTDPSTKAARLIMSNVHHRQLTPLMWARSLDYYDRKVLAANHNYKGSKRDVLAKTFNISGTTVHRYMALLKLIPEFQECTDRMNFPYSNLYEVTSLSPDMQKELFNRLTDIAEDGDISKISKTMIDQQVNRLKMEEERKQKKEQWEREQKEISEQVAASVMEEGQPGTTMSANMEIEEPAVAVDEPVPDIIDIDEHETIPYNDIPVSEDITALDDIQPLDSVLGNDIGRNIENDDIMEFGAASIIQPHVDESEVDYDNNKVDATNEKEIDNQLTYYVHRIEDLVSDSFVIGDRNTRDNCISALKQIIDKLQQ